MGGYDQSLYRMYLAAVPMFARCTPAQLDLVGGHARALSFRTGHDIVREGEAGDGFYVVTSGLASVHRDGRQLAQLRACDYFGELSLFDPAPRTATVTADDDVTCVVLAPDDFTRALDGIPAVRDALMHGMARRIHELDARV